MGGGRLGSKFVGDGDWGLKYVEGGGLAPLVELFWGEIWGYYPIFLPDISYF